MPQKPKMDWTAKERAELFHERYGEELDAGSTLVALAKASGLYLAQIAGEETARAAMTSVVESLDADPFDPENWADALDDASSDAFSSWPMGPQLHDLTAYAIYGIVLGDVDKSESEARIRTIKDSAAALLAASPINQWNLNDDGITDFERLVLLAENRWALDHKEDVEPAALAEFGGLSERSVRNMMSGPNKTFQNRDGRIPAHEALTWLEGRDRFWNSIWRDQPLARPNVLEAGVEDPLFVPVARDGSVFQPGIGRKNGFTVGEKGNERQIHDFDSALMELQKMAVPYWRRPNEKKIFGIVRGVRWERLDRKYLESVSADQAFKLAAIQ